MKYKLISQSHLSLSWFFLSFYLFLIVKGQFQQITPNNTLTLELIKRPQFNYFFSIYPEKSTKSTCTSFYYILVTNNEDRSNITSVITSNTISKIENKYNSFNFNFFCLTVSDLPYGPSTINITATTNTSVVSTYQLNIYCNEFDFNIIKFGLVNEVAQFNGIFFSSTVFFEGVKQSFFSTQFQNSNEHIFTTNTESNFGTIIWNPFFENIFDDLTIQLEFIGKNITLSAKSYYNQSESQPVIMNQTFLPETFTNKDYSKFGYGYDASYEIRYNTQIARPCQYVIVGSDPIISFPIKGTRGGLTFYAPIKATGTINFSMFSQNQWKLLSSTFNGVSIEFPIPPLSFGSFDISANTVGSIETVLVSFNSRNFKFTQLEYKNYRGKIVMGWPFGFVGGNNENFSIKINFPRELYYIDVSFPFYLANYLSSTQVSGTIQANEVPQSTGIQILSFEIVPISSLYFLYRFNISSVNGVAFLYNGEKTFGIECLVHGTIYNGIFEVIYGSNILPIVNITDIYGKFFMISYGDIYSYDPVKFFISPLKVSDYLEIQLSSFESISFEVNDLNLLNNSVPNILRLNLTDAPMYTPLSLVLFDPVSSIRGNQSPIFFPITFNTTERLFTSKFIVPKNNIFGEISFLILYGKAGTLYSQSLPYKNRLRVKQSYLDAEGPLINKIEYVGGSIGSTSSPLSIGFRLAIEDDYNGLDRGYLKMVGSLDSTTYQFNFTSGDAVSGDRWMGIYEMLVNVSLPCASQEFVITDIELYDTNNVPSIFGLFLDNASPFLNPFKKILDLDLNILSRAPYICTPNTVDVIAPSLMDFISSHNIIDVGATDRSILFGFIVQYSNILHYKIGQNPIVYCATVDMKLHQCRSQLVSITLTNPNDSLSPANALFKCNTTLPIGFGFPNIISFSVYGIVATGSYSGYSSIDLHNKNFSYFTNTTFSTDQPSITNTESIFSDGGELIIYGRGFLNAKSVLVKYFGDVNFSQISIPSLSTGIVVTINNIKQTTKSFTIKVEASNSLFSNEYVVIPINFEATPIPIPTPTTSETPTPTASETPTPTTIPKKCQGNPECGGSEQGYCSYGQCICYSPWQGTICSSKVIIVPQPPTNTTNPSVDLPTTPSTDEREQALFKCLVSLVSLRELNFDGIQVKNFVFDKWIYTPISEFKNQYFTTIETSSSPTTASAITNITATLEWFNASTNVEFANNVLIMNPSSIKYTIEITKYTFESKLNQLQLVMSALFQSTKSDICSSKQFDQTLNPNSNNSSDYIVLSVDDRSLYGRFIKRALIDNTTKSVSNVLLDSSLNLISQDSSTSVQSYIGITIPQFKTSVIIDPDFSILVDSKSASSSSINSICSKSGLTTSQLAGIIVGSCLFAIVLAVALAYYFIQKRKQKKFIDGVNQKLKNLN